jgi:alkaline phosphatase D
MLRPLFAATLGALLLLTFGCTSPRPSPSAEVATRDTTTVTRIAFGSCNKQYLDQPFWPTIGAQDPQVWLWLGDNIYADTLNMAALASMYDQQAQHPGYRQFAAGRRVFGTWDDHDYGANDAGRTFPKRDSSQQAFLDFFGVADDDPRRDREGVYSAHVFGPPGQRVKIILLDTRYHRDPITRSAVTEQRYFPNREGDILGAAQWQWLERQLTQSDAQVHLIGTSIQAVAEDHPFEKWANFPQARQRLIRTIRSSGAPGVVLLSGDRHFAELSRLDPGDVLNGNETDRASAGYPLYELTASGMTHSYLGAAGEPNRHRVGDLFVQRNYGLLTIDWAAETLRLQVRDIAADTVGIEQTLPLDELQPPAAS